MTAGPQDADGSRLASPGDPAFDSLLAAGATDLGDGWTTTATSATWVGEPGDTGQVPVVRIGMSVRRADGAQHLTFETGHIDPGPYDIDEDDETTQAEVREMEMEDLAVVRIPFPAAEKMMDLMFTAMTLTQAAAGRSRA